MDLKRAWVWSTLCQQLPGGQRNYSSKCWRISRRAWLRIVSVNFSSVVILQFRGTEHGLLNIGTNHQRATISRNPYYSSDSHSHLYPVYKARRKPGAEAVIDINNRDAGGAGIKHSQKGCEPMKARAVANAGRHGNYRLID